jgi:hypothetical protein
MRSGHSKPIGEFSRAEIYFVFFALPIVGGSGLLAFTLFNAWRQANDLSVADSFWQVGCMSLLALGLCTALPAAGWQELTRRRRERAIMNNPHEDEM